MAVRANIMTRIGADTSGLVSGFKRAGNAGKSFADRTKAAAKSAAGSMEQVAAAMQKSPKNDGVVKLVDQIRQLEAEQKSYESAGFSWGYEGFELNAQLLKSLKSQLEEYKASLSDSPPGLGDMVEQFRQLEAQQAKLQTADGTGTEAYAETARQLETMRGKIDDFIGGLRESVEGAGNLGAQLSAAKDALKQMEKAGLGAGDASWDEMYQTVERLKTQVSSYKIQLQKGMGPNGGDISRWRQMGQAAGASLRQMASGLKNRAITAGANAIKRVGNAAKNAAANGIKKLGSGIKSLAASGLRGLASIPGRLLRIGRSGVSADSGVRKITQAIKSVGVAAIGLKVAHAMFGRLRSVVSSYIGENATLQAQVDSLKAGMGNALAPAINIVANAFSALMPYIIGVSNAIGTLLVNLFGKGWTTMAAGASAAASATGSAAAAQEEYNRTLAGFDEITKLDSSKDSGGGGGGGGSTGSSTTAIAGKLPGWMTDLAGQIKQAFNAGDFEGIGEILATKLGGAVDKARNLLNNSEFRRKVNAFVDGAAGIINGFFRTISYEQEDAVSIAENIGGLIGDAVVLGLQTVDRLLTQIDFASIGRSIAQAINGAVRSLNASDVNFGTVLADLINAAVDGAKGMISTLDFGALGTAIASNLNSAMHGIDWANAGQTVSDGIKGALDMLRTAIREFDWAGLGTSIKTFFSNVDWTGIVESFAAGCGELAGGIAQTLWSMLGDAITSVYDYFDQKIQDAGGNVLLGILNGIIDGIASIGTWIKEHIFQPFIDGFKSVFGIHSPASNSEITGLGGNLISGVLNGIISGIASIGTWIKEHIFQPFVSAFGAVFSGIGSVVQGIFSGIGEITMDVVAKAKELKDGIVSVAKKTISGVRAKATELKDSIKNKIISVVAKAKELKDDIKDKAIGVVAKAKELKDDIVDGAKKTIGNVTAKASELKDDIKEKAVGVVAKAKELKDDIVDGAKKTIGNVTAKASELKDGIVDGAKKLIGGVTAKASELKDGITGGKTINGVTAGISKAENKLSSSTRTLGGFTASLTSWSDSNLGSRNLSGFNASLKTYSDNMPSGTRWVSWFGASLMDWRDKMQSGTRWVDWFGCSLLTWRDNMQSGTRWVSSFGATVQTWYDGIGGGTRWVYWFGADVYTWYDDIDNNSRWISMGANITTVKNTSGANLSGVQYLSYRQNAAGGILNSAQVFGAIGNTLQIGGEAGREALLPLDSNTEWMDRIADKVAGRMTAAADGGTGNNQVVQLVLDGRVIYQTVVDQTRKESRRTGGSRLASVL